MRLAGRVPFAGCGHDGPGLAGPAPFRRWSVPPGCIQWHPGL